MTAPLELGISVTDLDSMVRFYVEVLGCTEVERRTLPAGGTRRARLSGDGPVELSFLQTPWGERIKLLRAVVAPPPVPAAPFLTDRRGVAYLTFYVEGIDAVAAVALAAGAPMLLEPPVLDGADNRIAFFRDPEGNVIELVERDDITTYRPDLRDGGPAPRTSESP